MCEFSCRFLRRRGDFATFYLAQVGGLDAHTFRYLADRVLGVRLSEFLAASTDVLGERCHVCSVYYIVYVRQGVSREFSLPLFPLL